MWQLRTHFWQGMATALWLVAVGPHLDCARADEALDVYLVQTQVSEFFQAIAARDLAWMQSLWASDDEVAMLTLSKRRPPAVGWRAIRIAFQDGAFSFWNSFHAAPNDYPFVVIEGNVARATFQVNGVVRNGWGETVPIVIHVSQQFRKVGDHWLLTGSWALNTPD